MRTYKRDGYELRQTEHSHGDGRAYEVVLPDGQVLGIVETYQAAMERRSPGKRYVNKRWWSERWCVRIGHRFFWHAWETPGRAAEWLIWTRGEM